MILRRKKLLKSLCKKEAIAANPTSKEAISMISAMIDEREKQKSSLLENFKIGYLEEMLKSTTKSIARDVVSTLISNDTSGVLLDLENAGNSGSEIEEVKAVGNPSNDYSQNATSTKSTVNSKLSNTSVKFGKSSESEVRKSTTRIGSSGNRSNSSKPSSKSNTRS